MAANENLCEDTVRYALFLLKSNSSSVDDNVSCKVDKLISYVSSQLVEYIWQCDQFKLYPAASSGSLPSHLEGQTKYGDNIEDEWFIVHLLLELTIGFPDLIVKLWDSDGEFLLIEAAEHLPKWLNPDTSENRVYLYRGAVHIIPKKFPNTDVKTDDDEIIAPSIQAAIEMIRKNPLVTRARDPVQNVIKKRVKGYPEKIMALHHRAHVKVPAAVAELLKNQPSLLSSAVHAFYHRDPIDLKACRAMKYFPPETCVMTEVTFTRCLYAQLMQQKFKPDKRTGWYIPPINHPDFKSHDLGLKLACGFEILVVNATGDKHETMPEFDDLSSDVRWNTFLLSLKNKNYFRDEMEGSRLYVKLLRQAQDYFVNMTRHASVADGSTVGHKIKSMMADMDYDIEKLKQDEQNLLPADDDGWLNLNDEMLEEILTKDVSESDESRHRQPDAADLASQITSKLTEFVDHVSSHKGAEFPEDGNKTKDRSSRMTFDPDAFADICNNILDLNVPDWNNESEDSSGGMSDYSDDELDSDDDSPSELKVPRSKGKKPNGGANNANQLIGDMKQYMSDMDRELAQTDVGQSFVRMPAQKASDNESKPDENVSDGNETTEVDVQPIDVDLTALKNILDSYSSQQGLPGPASTILGKMGVQLPENADCV